MQPRERLTAKEIQVATLVWQGLTNKDVAAVLRTSEQVVKNYLRTAFDKLGVWTRLELALYVAGHGGANWHVSPGNGLLPASSQQSTPSREEGPYSGIKTRDGETSRAGNSDAGRAPSPDSGSGRSSGNDQPFTMGGL
jgi:DNA-binding CsgD family transcriptional regulator